MNVITKTKIQLYTQHVLNLEFSCTELVIWQQYYKFSAWKLYVLLLDARVSASDKDLPVQMIRAGRAVSYKLYQVCDQLSLNFLIIIYIWPTNQNPAYWVSKKLNHFGGIASFFRDWALGTLTDVIKPWILTLFLTVCRWKTTPIKLLMANIFYIYSKKIGVILAYINYVRHY